MADDTDFSALYRELGIEPDSSPEQFKRAYRRRVAELHPDRHGDGGTDDLTRLNRRYAAALAFLKDHGRLPGAAPAAAPSARPGRPGNRLPARAQTGGPSPQSDRLGWRILLAALVAVGAVWMFKSGALAPPTGPAGIVREPGHAAVPAPERPQLRLGMPVAAVRAIQGDPIGSEGGRWLYGASWLRFECDELVDWYSSPLQPLRTAAMKPPDPQPRRSPEPKRRCPPTAVPGAPPRERP